MARANLTHFDIEYRYAWWLRYYLQALLCACAVFGLPKPGAAVVARAFARAARRRIVGQAKWRKL